MDFKPQAARRGRWEEDRATAVPTPPATAVQTTEQRCPALKGLCRGDREHMTTRAMCAHTWHVCECVKSSHHVVSHDHRATFLFYDFITSQLAYRDFLKTYSSFLSIKKGGVNKSKIISDKLLVTEAKLPINFW